MSPAINSPSEDINGTRMLLGVPTEQISWSALLMTYEWMDLMVCTPDEMGSALSMLLRLSSLYTWHHWTD